MVADEDENRKMTSAEALKKIDEVKNFIEVNGSDHLSMIFNESIKNVEQMKLKKKKTELSLDLKIYFIYTVYSYRMKKILHLNLPCLFLPKNPKLYIADTWLERTLF